MTTIPLDFRQYIYPLREKYLIDETPLLQRWMEFGVHRDGKVDVASVDGDVFVAVPRHLASLLIQARNDFCDKVNEIVNEALKEQQL